MLHVRSPVAKFTIGVMLEKGEGEDWLVTLLFRDRQMRFVFDRAEPGVRPTPARVIEFLGNVVHSIGNSLNYPDWKRFFAPNASLERYQALWRIERDLFWLLGNNEKAVRAALEGHKDFAFEVVLPAPTDRRALELEGFLEMAAPQADPSLESKRMAAVEYL